MTDATAAQNRNQALEMWDHGRAEVIAAKVGCSSRAVYVMVGSARKLGDERAKKRDPSIKSHTGMCKKKSKDEIEKGVERC